MTTVLEQWEKAWRNQKARVVQAIRSWIVERDLENVTHGAHVHHCFERIVVGSGCAAAANVATLPGTLAAPRLFLPAVIAIADGPDPWSTRGSWEMGQPPAEFHCTAWRDQPSEFVDDGAAFTPSNAFAATVRIAHTVRDVPCVRGRVVSLSTIRDDSWEVPDARVRLEVRHTRGRKHGTVYYYARSVDFATGPGPGRRVEDWLFTDPARRRTGKEVHDALEASGQLVYSDRHLMGGADPLGGTVMVWGGGATGAWNAELAAKGGASVVWLARPEPWPLSHAAQVELDGLRFAIDRGVATAGQHERCNELMGFRRAMVLRNTGKGRALDNDSVTRAAGQVLSIEPSLESYPRRTVTVCYADAAGSVQRQTFDRLIVAFGQEQREFGGILSLFEYQAVTLVMDAEEKNLVALEIAGGALRVLGAALWELNWLNKIPDSDESATYRERFRAQPHSLAPQSRGIAVSINMIVLTVPKANDRLQL